LSDWQRVHAIPCTPNLLDFLTYCFALGNLLSGPYFEYSEWAEFIDLKGVSVTCRSECGGWAGVSCRSQV
jgi:lysophospholipid acyltransferase